jgi:hypothetical protein
MLPDLKRQMLRDNELVFFNPKGHAEKIRIKYQDREMELWGVIDEEDTAVRDKNNNQRKNDNEKALYQYDKYIWVNLKDFGSVPKRGRSIQINNVKYFVLGVSVEFGQVKITARKLNE